MKNKEIIEVVRNYLQEEKMNYALMINGKWGTGKTYFLKNTLYDVIKSIDSGKDKGETRKCAYISLYGVGKLEDVSKEIIFNILGEKNKKIVNSFYNIISGLSKVISTSVKMIDIDLSEIEVNFSEINIKNWILCFDDIERCNIPINEVLGFINTLVEHGCCKVILLADEDKIGNMNIAKNLEGKYLVSLQGRKLLHSNAKSDNSNEYITPKELNDITSELFANDYLYNSIREKLIGITIKFQPEMSTTYKSIIEMFKDTDYHAYLSNQEETILEIFKNMQNENLRTLIVSLTKFERIYNIINKKYNSIDIKDGILYEFLTYTIYINIYYRAGGKVEDLKLIEEIGYIKFNGLFLNVKGFKFIESFSVNGNLNESELEHVVSVLRKQHDDELAIDNNNIESLEFGKLNSWYLMEDDEVVSSIENLTRQLKENMYSFFSYSGIISVLLVLKKNKLFQDSIDSIIEIMNTNIAKSNKKIEIEKIGYAFSDDGDLQKEYDFYINKLDLKVQSKNNTLKSKELDEILCNVKWSDKLTSYCVDHFDDIVFRGSFLDLINYKELLNKLNTASVTEIYAVRNTFFKLYRMTNVKDIFIKDLDFMIDFNNQLKNIEREGVTSKIAITNLSDYIKEIIERLK